MPRNRRGRGTGSSQALPIRELQEPPPYNESERLAYLWKLLTPDDKLRNEILFAEAEALEMPEKRFYYDLNKARIFVEFDDKPYQLESVFIYLEGQSHLKLRYQRQTRYDTKSHNASATINDIENERRRLKPHSCDTSLMEEVKEKRWTRIGVRVEGVGNGVILCQTGSGFIPEIVHSIAVYTEAAGIHEVDVRSLSRAQPAPELRSPLDQLGQHWLISEKMLNHACLVKTGVLTRKQIDELCWSVYRIPLYLESENREDYFSLTLKTENEKIIIDEVAEDRVFIFENPATVTQVHIWTCIMSHKQSKVLIIADSVPSWAPHFTWLFGFGGPVLMRNREQVNGKMLLEWGDTNNPNQGGGERDDGM